MNYKKVMFLLVVILLLVNTPISSPVQAKEMKPTILFIYMTEDKQKNERDYSIEATLSSFAAQIKMISIYSLQKKDLNNIDTVVFVGDVAGDIPEESKRIINAYEGSIVGFGFNMEQLQVYNDWSFLYETTIRSVDLHSLSTPVSIIQTIPPKNSQYISNGKEYDRNIPFIVKNGRVSYVATTRINNELKYIFSKALFQVFNINQPRDHEAYIRLEGISPLSDPEPVKEAGEFLVKKNIPFYMAITPVEVNEKGKLITFNENKVLLHVLKKLQSNGGIVIANGYSSSYRYEEKGDGFEFWDEKYHQRISVKGTEEIPSRIKGEQDFSSIKEYKKYISDINRIERAYVEGKLTKSIQTLSAAGLYPLAFQAPNYAMTSNGYAVTADYFTSIFGRIQMSDNYREKMDAPLFISKPAILSGLTLYPETIGLIHPEAVDPLFEMRSNIEALKEVPGSVIGGYYHTYLGNRYLQEMVGLIESVPNLTWIDLQKTNQHIASDTIILDQRAGKTLKIEENTTLKNRIQQLFENSPFDFLLWVLAIVVSITILFFLLYIVRLKRQLRKRLFKERKEHG